MKGCYGKKQNIHDFLLLYQFLYVLLRTFFNTQIYDEERFIFHYGIYRCLLAMCH